MQVVAHGPRVGGMERFVHILKTKLVEQAHTQFEWFSLM
jgi:hypothetical protein